MFITYRNFFFTNLFSHNLENNLFHKFYNLRNTLVYKVSLFKMKENKPSLCKVNSTIKKKHPTYNYTNIHKSLHL